MNAVAVTQAELSIEPAALREAYEVLLPEIRAVPDAELVRGEVDVEEAVHAALAAVPAIERFRSDIGLLSHLVNVPLVDRLGPLAQAMLYIHRAERAELTPLRHQALTLLARAYDEARRVLAFLRWHEGDVDTVAPALFAECTARASVVVPKASSGLRERASREPERQQTSSSSAIHPPKG